MTQRDNELIAQRSDNDTYWIHTDHLGTPKLMEDEDQVIVWQARLSTFGEAEEIIENHILNIRFPGQYYDAESGLHYNYQRYYDPTKGRYISVDPLDLEGGINRYVYAGNNPLLLIDPKGEAFPVIVILGVEFGPACVAAAYAAGGFIARKVAQAVIVIGGTALLKEIIEQSKEDVCDDGSCTLAYNEAYENVTQEDVESMTVEELSACHAEVSKRRDYDHPCYGGDCNQQEYDRLNAETTKWCKRPERGGINLGACEGEPVGGIKISQLPDFENKLEIWEKCKQARLNRDNSCFRGGDKGHRRQIEEEVEGAIRKCKQRIIQLKNRIRLNDMIGN